MGESDQALNGVKKSVNEQLLHFAEAFSVDLDSPAVSGHIEVTPSGKNIHAFFDQSSEKVIIVGIATGFPCSISGFVLQRVWIVGHRQFLPLR